MELNAHVGGRPGIDCGGFCEFCFYKNVDFNKLESQSWGCIKCPPDQIGCDNCTEPINRVKSDFKPLVTVLSELERKLMMLELVGSLDYSDIRVSISGGADIFYYPYLEELVSLLKEPEMSVHLGYISGKGINDANIALNLINQGVDEISFSVFSTDADMRRKWMRDKTSEESLKALKLFGENIHVNASVVLIPGVNDGDHLLQTSSDLEDWGVETFVLRRFANFKYQGLILNDNKPVIEGIIPHTYEEFQKHVRKVSDEFSFKLLAFPFYDSKKDFPFALLERKNRKYLGELPGIKSEATVITGELAGPFLKEFFRLVDESNRVNVIALEKEIADLITHEDLESVDLAEIKKKVIIPSGALVHDEQAGKILSKDGVIRKIIRGPYLLTHPYYESVDFNQKELIEYELNCFKGLVDVINNLS